MDFCGCVFYAKSFLWLLTPWQESPIVCTTAKEPHMYTMQRSLRCGPWSRDAMCMHRDWDFSCVYNVMWT